MVVENKAVLVVDDDEDIREFLADLLATEGYRTEVAESGPAALEQAAGRKPDLVLLDIMMPGMDGYEVCERLKANPATRPIPVVMVTVRNEIEAISRSLVLGATGFIVKPFDSESLLQMVEMVLTRRPFDFYTGMTPAVANEPVADVLDRHERICFLDLLEVGGRTSIMLPAGKTEGNEILYLWQEPREEGLVETTAAVAIGSSDEFNTLLNIVAGRPTVKILSCQVYDRDIPLP